MEFNENQVFTSLNADKLSPGDKVILANTMANLRDDVERGVNIQTLREVHGEDCLSRFIGKDGWYPLAYLYEKGENCTNCVHREGEGCKPNVSPVNWCPCYDREVKQSYIEPRAEKHYRPFKNIDELVKVWVEKTKPYRAATRIPPLIMPLIWVRYKFTGNIFLINAFWKDIGDGEGDNVDIGCYRNVYVDEMLTYHDDSRDGEDGMADGFEFLDGSPCGVRE